jgi:mono/diheme cytochrome c family protein
MRHTTYLPMLVALLAGKAAGSAPSGGVPRTDCNQEGTVCCLSPGAPPASGRPGKTAVPLAIYAEFEKCPPVLVARSMEKEVAAIMAPVGLPVEWRPVTPVSQGGDAAAVAWISFRGDCDPGKRLSPSGRLSPLGWTHISDGEVLDIAEVDCNRIREVIHRDLVRSLPLEGQLLLGRAAGRVVAHELYHIFAATSVHSSEGLGKLTIAVEDLTVAEFRFQAQELHSIRARFSKVRLASNGSPVAGRYIYQENGCRSCHGSHGQGTRRGPPLRVKGRSEDFKTLAETLARGRGHESVNGRGGALTAPQLEEDEIGDLVSFLNAME